jgi:hypothetical protein
LHFASLVRRHLPTQKEISGDSSFAQAKEDRPAVLTFYM